MAGVIYTSSSGIDPGAGDVLTDPLFGPVPTLGACVPNFRRIVERGDWIFIVSGKKRNLAQYVIGGLQVADKIDALAAYERFPQNRMTRSADGIIRGNVPVDERGNQHPLDGHKVDGFERRVRNFIVGGRSIQLETPAEVALGRDQTLKFISDLRQKQGNRVYDVIGRGVKISTPDVDRMLEWLEGIKKTVHGQP